MGLTIEKVKEIEERKKVNKFVKYKETPKEARHLIKYKQEKDYEYYKCDYCGNEIKIEKDWEKRTGGIAILPSSITNRGKIEIAIHNKCLNKFLKELEGNK